MNRSTVRNAVVAATALLTLFPAAAMAATPTAAPARATAATAHHHHAAHVRGVVVTGQGRALHVRSGAGTTYRTTGTLRSGRQVSLVCKRNGSSVQGNRVWYRLAGHHGRYVSAHYVRVAAGSTVPWC
ncbi:SH3 domain-containing protein [Streptomyces sp. SID1034]|uniref:SH3 domain-containing protein n=1 Tax=Streptomyces sp. SID1034 TaxID=2690248 RepID=UPI00136B0DBE|nr:SH3 domain-containing protein [Streptomyces sp. SID1034]MYV91049.1 SH3 domain-containing protein [Streptomyces sp. SID1034]